MEVISLSSWVAEYEKNEIRFEKTFNNKKLKLKGIVSSISEFCDDNSTAFVVYLRDDYSTVSFLFSRSHEKTILELNCNDEIVIQGMFISIHDDLSSGLILHDCEVVRCMDE